MEILFRSHAPGISGVSVPEHQPPPSEKLLSSPEPLAAGLKPHLFYKCLLNQHAQKLKKSPPVYNTPNEGYGHMPKFRSTVLFDGVSYTSSNTFQQRKMAEMDVSRIAYITITQKFKSDALQFIKEDKTFCKSILMEYAAKMNLAQPKYETVQLATLVPVFRSSLVFNGVTYQGDDSKTKKGAEQLAARAVILKYLDSESAQDVAEIINCKFRQLVEMNKIQEMDNGHSGSNVALIEPKAELGTSTMPKLSPGVTQSRVQEVSIDAITAAVPVGNQPPIPEVFIAPITPAVSVVSQPPIPEVVIKAITPAVPAPVVLIQTASAKINSSTPTVVSSPSLVPLASIPATPLASNVIQPANSEALLSLASKSLEYIPLTGQTSGKKRSRKNKKNAQKRMCLDCLHAHKAIPVLPATQVQPFSSQ